tara:strand:+ start:143 stop:991 length:849 start_codon:yes stop_codon:yes gene_type:complete
MKFKSHFLLVFLVTAFFSLEAQDSNIQIYTPSKLMQSRQWDIKWFNNLYTETKKIDDKKVIAISPRENFFTSSLDIFTGLSGLEKWNIGLHLEYRSNTIDGLNATASFSFKNRPEQRRGLTRIAPAIKLAPFSSLTNFSIQSSFSIPLFQEESLGGVYLDQKGFIWQNKFFYDYSSSSGDFQVFGELSTEYNFGENSASYANDSFRVSPGIFVSYFPSQNIKVPPIILKVLINPSPKPLKNPSPLTALVTPLAIPLSTAIPTKAEKINSPLVSAFNSELFHT